MNDQKPKRGFAAMTPEQRQDAGRKGGKAANDRGVTHRWDRESARSAGQKGGKSVSKDRDHMAEIGRRGGSSRRADLTRRYRRVSWGRLYWKAANPNMKRFDTDDVCIVVSGTVTTHYKTVDRFAIDIFHAEMETAGMVRCSFCGDYMDETEYGAAYCPACTHREFTE